MEQPELAGRIEAVRRFSRFYTRKIGVLHEHLLDSPFSLAEARVVFEIAQRATITAAEIARDLGLDASYLSRLLKSLAARGYVRRERSRSDGREYSLSLTDKGRQGFAAIDARSRDQVAAMLASLDAGEGKRLANAMASIEAILGEPQAQPPVPYMLRAHGPGDIGWVIQAHALLYAREYGWGADFEAVVAQVAAQFLKTYDADRERCWIAERDGENVGSVMVVRVTNEVAQLRLLLVDPRARGLGIGKRLVDECIRFARSKGYRTITLWTIDVLLAARHIYEKAGFRLVKEEPHQGFGADLVGQTWELTL